MHEAIASGELQPHSIITFSASRTIGIIHGIIVAYAGYASKRRQPSAQALCGNNRGQLTRAMWGFRKRHPIHRPSTSVRSTDLVPSRYRQSVGRRKPGGLAAKAWR